MAETSTPLENLRLASSIPEKSMPRTSSNQVARDQQQPGSEGPAPEAQDQDGPGSAGPARVSAGPGARTCRTRSDMEAQDENQDGQDKVHL